LANLIGRSGLVFASSGLRRLGAEAAWSNPSPNVSVSAQIAETERRRRRRRGLERASGSVGSSDLVSVVPRPTGLSPLGGPGRLPPPRRPGVRFPPSAPGPPNLNPSRRPARSCLGCALSAVRVLVPCLSHSPGTGRGATTAKPGHRTQERRQRGRKGGKTRGRNDGTARRASQPRRGAGAPRRTPEARRRRNGRGRRRRREGGRGENENELHGLAAHQPRRTGPRFPRDIPRLSKTPGCR